MNGGLRILAAAGVAVLSLMPQAQAETVRGQARLLDGDTLEISGMAIRLHGVDAPETSQTCFDGSDRAYRCGEDALDGLRRFIGNRRVTCDGLEYDRYDRLIATCRAGETDLNRAMVRAGLAVAYRRYSEDYLEDELDAFKNGRGIWRGRFERPYVERERRWADASQKSPNGCPIKGNISKRGRIYHTPWSRHYSRTRINTSKGERWFCSEDEALKAGWRAPFR